MKPLIAWKVFAAFLFVSVSSLVVVYLYLAPNLSAFLRKEIENNLVEKVYLIRDRIEALPSSEWETKSVDLLADRLSEETKARVTIIDRDGKVLGDSDLNGEALTQLENHLHRPEIDESLGHPYGLSRRYSTTVKTEMMYIAVKTGRGFVRAAIPLRLIDETLGQVRHSVLLAAVLALVLSSGIGLVLSRSLTRSLKEMSEVAQRIAQGDFSKRIHATGRDEFGDLGRAINTIAENMDRQVTDLRRLENVRKEFVANVSHELKTPLTCIRGYAETLRTGALDDHEAAARFVEKIESNAGQLQNLVEDILKLSEIESGRQEMARVPVDLRRAVETVLEGVAEALKNKKLFCDNNISEGTLASGDPQAFRQILGNLIDNAVKYTPEGGRIMVSSEALGSFLRVTVADTGIGISEKDLPRVFERFYRADKARSRQMGGTGLGLAIVKHLVQAQGGEVGVKSEVGKGSEFWFTVPL